MATEVEALLHDVLVFMQQLLRLELPQLGETQLRGLVARLQQADTAFRPAYMDMKGTLQRPPRALADSSPPPPAARPESQVAVDDTDSADKWLWTSGDVGDLDTSADCSECQDGSLDDWPPRGAPSCPRPDLSPDYAVSAAAAKELAVRSGVVHRGGPGRWFRVGRRGWAALLPAPARLLVFAGPRSSRPRLVLPLVAPGGGGGGAAPCCDPCCAVYCARRRQGPAFELCCPGRKTHELWVSDDDEAQSWVDALRRASQDAAGPSPASPSTPISRADESLTASSVAAALGADDAKLHSGSRSRSQSRAGSAEATDCSAASQLPGLADQPPAPPLTPPPGPDDGQQQEYESMVSGGEEIYHDIAPPEKDAPSYANGVDYADGPSYANLASTASARASPERLQDDADLLARPLYDDVAARPQTPHYCNVAAEKAVEAENLYDDIGVGHSEGRASVYELIQDPVSQTHLGQSIRCS